MMSEIDSLAQPRSKTASGFRSPWKVFFAVWALLALMAVCWSFATPLAAAPDEPAHTVKAASVARGQFIGTPSRYGHIVEVPRYVASTQVEACFAFQPQQSAACAAPLDGDPGDVVLSTTTAGLYNPVYYLLVGWPTLFLFDDSGIYAMRIVSGILSTFFLALAFMIASTFRRPVLPIASLGVAVPPMLLFLSGVLNPNALETAATLAAFVAMVALITQPDGRHLLQRWVILTAASAIAVNTRALSPLWLAVALFLPLLLLVPGRLRALLRESSARWAIGAIGAATAVAVIWILGANSLASGITVQDTFQQFPGKGASPLSGFIIIIRRTVEFARSMIGSFGWLDTPAPELVFFIWAAFVGALLLAAGLVLKGRRLGFSIALAGAFVLLPAIVQGVYITGGGIIWQGRYSLPLFAMLVFGIGAVLAESLERFYGRSETRLMAMIGVAWAIAQFSSFIVALRRYSVGSSGSWHAMIASPNWEAPLGNITIILVFLALSIAAAVAVWRWAAKRSRIDYDLRGTTS